MTEVLKIDSAGMLNEQELLIELLDGRVVAIDVDQVLSLNPGVVETETQAAEEKSTNSSLY